MVNNFYLAGIDIGGTNTVYGLVDVAGICVASDEISTKDTAEELFSDLAAGLEKLLYQQNNGALKGIGIGAPNANYYTGMLEDPPNLPWKSVNIVDLMGSKIHVPVAVTNDANAAAIGEKLYGAGKDINHFIVITLGTGLGSGIVTNGKILHGAFGHAGEIGHMNVYPKGRLCGCGRRGCLETYVSASGICRTASELIAKNPIKSLIHGVSPRELTPKMLCDFATDGDRIARQAFAKTGKILGSKLADVMAVTEPEYIYLFGGLANAGDLLLSPTRKAFEKHLLPIYRGKTKIVLSGLQGKNIAVLGAAALIKNEIDKKNN